ncbi:SAM hydrolase/SAM-dependent halogenase family protein [Thiocystis violacea]|uniref:SAM hydrolase/SAM-dependent halogenase family protein n=1 Tax=Thiocystis violacea TaxID=13725 RepID=UPI001903B65E|nr:SAM-dependent chlorinase/fluorinase [Thiocystis violacea]MBK1716294.1 hypothetical protein [Thiocystis violacea]
MKRPGIERILLATDFGEGPYMGQMRARLGALRPETPTLDLIQDLPPFRPDLAAYLLPALARDMPRRSLYLCVVDPGVGGERAGLLVQADGDWFMGPDNGLFALAVRRALEPIPWRIGWRPPRMSASFHGRDWFAPAAARLCRGEDLELSALNPGDILGSDWPDELPAILYVDCFGNLITGLTVPAADHQGSLCVGTQRLPRARTFCEVAPGQAFWYENAFGLIEIAVNQGRADRALGLSVGDSIGPLSPDRG